jgi:exodeoxyribonuclease V alpha subunit
LLYTAVTRAKEHVRLIGTHAALVHAVENPIVRASGLRHQA